MNVRRNVIRDIILQTVKLIVILLIFTQALQPNGIIARLLGISTDLSPLLPTVIVFSLILYVSSIIQKLFLLKIKEVLNMVFNGLAIATATYLFNQTPWTPEIFRAINFWVYIFMLSLIFYGAAKSLSSLYNEPLIHILSASVFFIVIGVSSSMILTTIISHFALHAPFGKIIANAISLSCTVAAIIFPLSLLKYSRNPYLHYLGGMIESRINRIFLLLLLLQLYFEVLRPQIVSSARLSMPLELIEWGALCFSIGIFYLNLRSQVSKRIIEPLNLGKWTILRQEIEYRTDPEQLNLAALIEEFIELGIREGLIAYLALLMFQNNLPLKFIKNIIRKVLDFKEVPYPRIFPESWHSAIDEENKRRRRKLLEEVLDEIEQYLKMRKLILESSTSVGERR